MKLAKTILTLGIAAVATLASAGQTEPYTQKRFNQLAAQGKPALVAVHADWCPTCKAQKPILSELMGKPDYKGVTELVVDYDADKAAVKKHKVSMQSTLIAFKGGKEVGRSVGDTTKAGIEGLVKKAAN
ncbi:MAG: hypothetical protein NVS2B4_07960 [Ramlibacter sp.]